MVSLFQTFYIPVILSHGVFYLDSSYRVYFDLRIPAFRYDFVHTDLSVWEPIYSYILDVSNILKENVVLVVSAVVAYVWTGLLRFNFVTVLVSAGISDILKLRAVRGFTASLVSWHSRILLHIIANLTVNESRVHASATTKSGVPRDLQKTLRL